MGYQCRISAAMCLLALMATNGVGGETYRLPVDRQVGWRPGCSMPIPFYPVVLNLKDLNPKADGKTDDAAVFKAAIEKAKTPGAILVPAGTYLLKDRLDLKSGLVLRGEGFEKTHLIFNIEKKVRFNGGSIGLHGKMGQSYIAITDGYGRGSTKLTIASTEGLKPGKLIWVFSSNDAKKMYTRESWNVKWASNSVGQMVNVTKVSGNVVEIDTPLRLGFSKKLKPRLVIVTPIKGAGVESMHIKRLDKQEDSIIAMFGARNCWVRDCELDYCMRSHVTMAFSRHITIEGNYMHHAWNYGGGGHGYGVVLGLSTSDSLVTNNVFRTLRHSMMVKTGANGNVLSYNCSGDVQGRHPGADISVHGHYSYMNLFEGNVVQFIKYADWWGPTGPLTTSFRNRVTKGIAVADASHRATVIGNTTRSVKVSLGCRESLVGATRSGGKLDWGKLPQDSQLPASLYLDGPPKFWGDRPWPAIGADVDEGKPGSWIKIPAHERYDALQ